MAPSSRSDVRRTKGEERSRTMYSLGLNRTTLKHVLTPNGHSDSDDDKHLLSSEDKSARKCEESIAAPSKKGNQPLTDVEAQAARIRSARHSQAGPRMSLRRKLYIAGTALVCVLIVVIGIVVGVRIVTERNEAKEDVSEANSAQAQSGTADVALLSEGMSVQARLQAQMTAVPTTSVEKSSADETAPPVVHT